MPTMPERMSVVETDVRTVRSDVGEIKGDVKLLLGWMHEERGKRAALASERRKLLALLTALATTAGGVAGAAIKMLGG